jgi:hypothetical protein
LEEKSSSSTHASKTELFKNATINLNGQGAGDQKRAQDITRKIPPHLDGGFRNTGISRLCALFLGNVEVT